MVKIRVRICSIVGGEKRMQGGAEIKEGSYQRRGQTWKGRVMEKGKWLGCSKGK